MTTYQLRHLTLSLCCLMLAGCALLEEEDDEEPVRPPARSRSAAAAAEAAESNDTVVAAPPFEDSVLEDNHAASPTPAAVAALPPDHPAAAAAPEGDSLLGLIGHGTPPNVAAALRIIDAGRVQMEAGHFEQALERYERGLAIDPSNLYGYYYLARLHYLRQNYDQASAFATRAAALSARAERPWQARVYALQAEIFEAIGRYPDARRSYQNAIDADPGNLPARNGVARLSAP